MRRPKLAAATLLAFATVLGADAPPRLAAVAPEEAGLDGQLLAAIEPAVQDAIQRGMLPGCVVAIGRHGRLGYLRAFGDRALRPAREAMTLDTVFDLASLTKPICTAASIFLLIERGLLRLSDKLAEALPGYRTAGKDDPRSKVTVGMLLTHTAGFIPDNSLKDYESGPEAARANLLALVPKTEPGTAFKYSDVGFQLLGEIVKAKTGQGIDAFAQANLFRPLGMKDTDFVPSEGLRKRAAPTEMRDEQWIRGEVHDPRAHKVGGVAGHAGLFSTAADLAVYANMLLGGGETGGVRVLGRRTVELMTSAQPAGEGRRTFGWDSRSSYSVNRGETMSDRAFGHGGFTGTAMWVDPELDLFVIFLSNRVHPNGKGSVNGLAGRIGTIAASAVLPAKKAGGTNGTKGADGTTGKDSGPAKPIAAEPAMDALPGIDVLKAEGFARLKGRKVGLVTNHTGVDRDGTPTIDLLHKAPGVTLVALFSPEHGIRGDLDVSKIDDGKDAKTGLPVYSLYGKTRKPTAEQLKGVDTLVYDIQDVGCRFYTYISTLGLCLEAAAERKLRVMVLDRPNPIGDRVDGPVLDAGKESFVAYHRLPVQHGLTVGELARLFVADKAPAVPLEVVKVGGWKRDRLFDATGLAWVNPSPNMRTPTQALVYPGVGLLETTNVSVGRGTDTPFEVVGAPWLDGRGLAKALNGTVAGVRFVPTAFTPTASKFQGKACGGVRILVTDRAAVVPLRLGMALATALWKRHPTEWEIDRYDRLLGHAATLAAVCAGLGVPEIEALWRADLAAFRGRRDAAKLYE